MNEQQWWGKEFARIFHEKWLPEDKLKVLVSFVDLIVSKEKLKVINDIIKSWDRINKKTIKN